MSNDSATPLQFLCPQCNRKLKAPVRLAGKKLACPHCQGNVKVPGNVASVDDADDWLNLSEPSIPTLRPPQSKHSTPKISAPKPNPSDKHVQTKADVKADGTNDGKAAAKKTVSTAKPSAGAVPKSSFDDDDFQLAPAQPEVKPSFAGGVDIRALASELDSVVDVRNEQTNRTVDEKIKSRKKSQNWEMKPLTNPDVADAIDVESQAEFRFSCKRCSTVMYANLQLVGSKTKCPDCHSEISIPRPPAGWDKKKAVALKNKEIRERDQRRKDEAQSKVTLSDMDRSVQATLAKAEAELDAEKADDMSMVYDFDTRGWLRRTFSLFTDPTLLLFASSSAAVLAVVVLVSNAFASAAEETQGASVALQLMVLFGVGVPIMGLTLANGLAVLQASANRLKRVPEWPLLNPGEWWEDSICAVVAFALAALPGATLAWILKSYDVGPGLCTAIVLLSIWFLTPPLLLSILDNQSIFEPISMNVMRSYSSRADSWAGMYVVTGAAAFALFLMISMGFGGVKAGAFLAGAGIPFVSFFLFHQMGILASQISDVTSLGFETDAVAQAKADRLESERRGSE